MGVLRVVGSMGVLRMVGGGGAGVVMRERGRVVGVLRGSVRFHLSSLEKSQSQLGNPTPPTVYFLTKLKPHLPF